MGTGAASRWWLRTLLEGSRIGFCSTRFAPFIRADPHSIAIQSLINETEADAFSGTAV